MEKKLDRYLEDYEQVDHNDLNYTNDDINNLQILHIIEHQKLDHIRLEDVIVNCIYCGREFVIKGNDINDRNRKKSGPFCSKQCIGKYGAEIQNKRITEIGYSKVERIYYRNKNK